MNNLKSEISMGFNTLYCKYCNKKTPHIAKGFEGVNRRLQCMQCGCEVKVKGVWD